MKLKINKACDLSSISVLPPQSRRSNVVAGGLESASIYGKFQLRSQQQPQQSQQPLSQGVSSQHDLFSQLSQNSQDVTLTNEKIGSQERENSVKRLSGMPLVSYNRGDSQMVASRTSSNLMRSWSGQENRCHISEELEHRIGMIETSLSRLGMILDSVQSDIMQVNKGSKEVALEMDGMRQKLIGHDGSLQLLNKGQEDIKSRVDIGLKSLSDQLKQNMNQENLKELFSALSLLSEKVQTQMLKLQNDLCQGFGKELQAIICSMKIPEQYQATPPIHELKAIVSGMNTSKQNEAAPPIHGHTAMASRNKNSKQEGTPPVQGPKASSFLAPTEEMQFQKNRTHSKPRQAILVANAEAGGWSSVKQGRTVPKVGNSKERSNQIKVSPNQLELNQRVVIESDEDIDGGFSCLLTEKRTEINNYSMEEAKEETARILRKARRRKRKYSNTIIIN